MTSVLAANLLRRPGRALLTALGTAVGVRPSRRPARRRRRRQRDRRTAGAPRSGGSRALPAQRVRSHHVGAADLARAADRAAAPGSRGDADRAARRGALLDQPSALVFGAEPDGFPDQATGDGLRASGGGFDRGRRRRRPRTPRGLTPGAGVVIAGRPFTVAGVYHSGIAFEDTGAVISLRTAQGLAGRPGEATTIAVQLTPGAHANAAKEAIMRAFPGLVAFDEPGEAVRAGANGRLVTQAATVIVVLALLIGGIAVMNTQLLATLERRGEFAVMSAVGWTGARSPRSCSSRAPPPDCRGRLRSRARHRRQRPARRRARRARVRRPAGDRLGARPWPARRWAHRPHRRPVPGLARRAPASRPDPRGARRAARRRRREGVLRYPARTRSVATTDDNRQSRRMASTARDGRFRAVLRYIIAGCDPNDSGRDALALAAVLAPRGGRTCSPSASIPIPSSASRPSFADHGSDEAETTPVPARRSRRAVPGRAGRAIPGVCRPLARWPASPSSSMPT